MIKLSLNELKQIAESRGVNDSENISEKDLTKVLTEPRPKINFTKKKKEIKKDFSKLRHKFPKSEWNKFRKSFYVIKNIRNLAEPEIREAEESLIELEESLHDFKKQHNYDDNEYKGRRCVKSLFNQFDKYY